jgi:predicted RNA-binding Zn-ribbon protein involved in translation (DUF1610 family)
MAEKKTIVIRSALGSAGRVKAMAKVRPKPAAPAQEPVAAIAVAEEPLRFFCIHCENRLAVPPHAKGVKLPCPACNREISIPADAPAAAPPAPPPPPKTFTFFCVRCGQGLEAEVDMGGMAMECPACGREILIPPPLEE